MFMEASLNLNLNGDLYETLSFVRSNSNIGCMYLREITFFYALDKWKKKKKLSHLLEENILLILLNLFFLYTLLILEQN